MNWIGLTASLGAATGGSDGPPVARAAVDSRFTNATVHAFVLAVLAFLFVTIGLPRAAFSDDDAAVNVTAKLVEIPSKFPPDDLYDYAYVMRYEVIGGPLDKSSIFVAHYKPRQPRSKIKDKMKDYVGGKVRSFVVGDVHKMKLSPNLKKVWKGALVDDFAATDHTSVRYWCLEADPS
jgi:hypothetical protein